MPEPKSKVFKVVQKTVHEDAPTRTRLIRADRRSAVESFLLAEVTIDVASQDDLLALAKTVEVENVSPSDPAAA